MMRLQTLLSQIEGSLLRISPDRLWGHYCLALAITLCLLFVTSAVSQHVLWHATSDLAAFSNAVSKELAYLQNLLSAILAISVIVLFAEALLIFLPAHLVVQSSLKTLREQAASLCASKRELQQMNDRLVHLSNHDPLTGLANREYLIALLKEDQTIYEKCFLVIGLDGFKLINDTIGRDAGDALLIAISDALQTCVNDDDIVAHIGGDEFAIMTDEPAKTVVQRLLATIETPFALRGRVLRVNASIGYLILDGTEKDPTSMLADANVALRVAKSKGGHRAQLFTPKLRENAGLLQSLQLELPDAIRNGELEPWFQPQVRMADGALHGVEVLARWRHPTRGLLTPDLFLRAVEKSGTMIEMDHTIWRSAMAYAAGWQAQGLWRPVISLNAGPETLSDPYLVERFLIGLRKSGLSADQIILEVLETTVIDGAGDMITLNIDTLAECGIAIELDDFGTGYASLCRLTQLPLSGIKLDRSLVAPLPDKGAGSIVRAILTLAADLGLQVIAEGVEDARQAAHLTETGCEIGQGYGFVRPMPPQEFHRWLVQYGNSPVTISEESAPLAKQA